MGKNKEEITDLAAIEQQYGIVESDNRAFDAILFDNSKFNQIQSLAKMMASSMVMLPKDKNGQPLIGEAECFAIAMKATQWGMNAFTVLEKTHVVNGKLGYEAQLVNAVINNSGAIVGRPSYRFEGDWSKIEGKANWNPSDEKGLGVTVICTLKNGDEREWTCWMSSCKVRNSPNWKSKPKLQTCYQAIKEWCRVHTPDVILGVYTPDELQEEAIVTVREIPKEGGNVDKLAAMMDDEPVEEVRKPEVTIEPEVEEKPAKNKPAAKKKTSAKKAEPTLDEAFKEAVKATGVPEQLFLEYCVAKSDLMQPGATLENVPKNWKESVIQDPAKWTAAVNAWCDGEEQ